MGPEGSLPCSQELSTGPWLDTLDWASYLFKICFNIILPLASDLFPLVFSTQNSVCISDLHVYNCVWGSDLGLTPYSVEGMSYHLENKGQILGHRARIHY